MKNFSKMILKNLYLTQKLNPYQIAEQLGANHKTIRAYLRKYKIPMRKASEYNYLPRKSHESPDEETLQSLLSVAGHVAFLCEGWHTPRTDMFQFSNTDTALIDLMLKFLKHVYKMKKVRVCIMAASKKEAAAICELYPQFSFTKELTRKTPIVRLCCGGKNFARELIENAYRIVSSLN